jgi:hypothetical protein
VTTANNSIDIAGPNALNVGQAGDFQATLNGVSTSGTWNFGDGTTSSPSTTDPSHSWSTAGTYTISVDDGNGGTGSKTVTVTNPSSNLTVAGNACVFTNESTEYMVSGGTPPYTYTASSNLVSISGNAFSGRVTVTAAADPSSAEGDVTITATDSANLTGSKNITVVKVESETVATVPSDRARTKVGVYEEVVLSVYPTSLTADWSFQTTEGDKESTLSNSTGSSTTFTASMSPKTTKIKASIDGVDKVLTYTVITPSTLRYKIVHRTAYTSPLALGYRVYIYAQPVDVNFSAIYIRENEVFAQTSGYFTYQQGLRHDPGSRLKVTETLDNEYGWQLQGHDEIAGATRGPQYTNGSFSWPIDMIYDIEEELSSRFTVIDQVKTLTIDAVQATLTIEKGNATSSKSEALQ